MVKTIQGERDLNQEGNFELNSDDENTVKVSIE